MIAKGHHFPDVTLVGVVNADLTLRFPDFRAEERTFAMLVQVGGRSGRGERPGRVLVQTLDPEARPIALAAAGEHERFYADELARRTALGYPPATHAARRRGVVAGGRQGDRGRRLRGATPDGCPACRRGRDRSGSAVARTGPLRRPRGRQERRHRGDAAGHARAARTATRRASRAATPVS